MKRTDHKRTEILRCIASHKTFTVDKICQSLGFAKGTVTPVLYPLQHAGFLKLNKQTKIWKRVKEVSEKQIDIIRAKYRKPLDEKVQRKIRRKKLGLPEPGERKKLTFAAVAELDKECPRCGKPTYDQRLRKLELADIILEKAMQVRDIEAEFEGIKIRFEEYKRDHQRLVEDNKQLQLAHERVNQKLKRTNIENMNLKALLRKQGKLDEDIDLSKFTGG